MEYLISFLIGFFLNDSRILYKIYGGNLQYIKYKVVLKDLGLEIYLICVILNYLKGLLPFILFSKPGLDLNITLMAICLIYGLFLGSKPGKTEGSELIVIWGIYTGLHYKLIQIPFAVFISLLLLTRKLNISFGLSTIIILINLLLNKNFNIFFLSLIILVNYVINNYALFSPLLNKIKGKLTFQNLKG